MTRRILLVTHPGRADVRSHVRELVGMLKAAGIEVVVSAAMVDEALVARSELGHPELADPVCPAVGCELVLVLGGDGTILRGAEVSRDAGVPLLGINFGHVGFLAEAEAENLRGAVTQIADTDYAVQERMTVDITARVGDRHLLDTWALNEVSLEKVERGRMIMLTMEIDGRPVSTWGCDGVILATPTGSTAYAFSAGGPVMWPDVKALLVVPISAHALFARPLVVAPDSRLAVDLPLDAADPAVVWCDGLRSFDLPPGGRVEVTHGRRPVLLARLNNEPFADRLVTKFALPVEGWRGAGLTR